MTGGRAMNYWLIKNPPKRLVWGSFVTSGFYRLYGIRNRQARNYLSAMKPGDMVVYYQSQVEQSVRGIAKVISEAYPDPSSIDPQWVAVDLEPLTTFERPLSLEQLRCLPILAELRLFRQPRLSVMPLTEPEYLAIRKLSDQLG